jgi:hypothetical protein
MAAILVISATVSPVVKAHVQDVAALMRVSDAAETEVAMSRPGPLIDLLIAPLRHLLLGDSESQIESGSLVAGMENLRALNEKLAKRGH